MSLDALYITYWSLRDPLCQSQSLPVLKALAQRGWRLGLVTYEQAAWALTPTDERQMRSTLEREGIEWLPLRYHKRPPVLSTLYDIVRGVLRSVRLVRTRRIRLLHARATVPCAVAQLAARFTGAALFADADGPLSQEYVDAGVWRAGSWVARLTARAERRAISAASAVAVLTDHRRREVADWTTREVTVLPCAVDTGLFRPRPEERERVRRELGLGGSVLVYVGKWGGWYAGEAMLDFASAASAVLDDVRLLVVSMERPERFLEPARARGLRCVVRSASREEMPAYLSAADVGLSFVKPLPSKAACSPIKNGEYLACGLPLVTTPNIGDYSELVAERRVGVVVPSLDDDGYRIAAEALRRLLRDAGLGERCRAAALAAVGLDQVVLPRYFGIYKHLLGAPRSGAA